MYLDVLSRDDTLLTRRIPNLPPVLSTIVLIYDDQLLPLPQAELILSLRIEIVQCDRIFFRPFGRTGSNWRRWTGSPSDVLGVWR
jgi:hypothetical protein